MQGLPQLCHLRRQKARGRKAEKDDRTGQPVVDRDMYSARYSRWDDDKAWSSQKWKADKSMDDRTGQPVVASRARTHEFQSSLSREKTKHFFFFGRRRNS